MSSATLPESLKSNASTSPSRHPDTPQSSLPAN